MLQGAPHNSHGFSQYDTVLASHVRKVPQSLSFDAAAIADCYAVAVHAVHRVGGVRDQVVAIIGCGTIGLCVGQTSRALGAARVVIIGDQANALDVALSSQAANDVILVPTNDPASIVLSLTGGVGPTVVFEAVGRSGSTLEEALELVAPAGHVCIVGAFTSPPVVSPQIAYEKEASLLWSNSYGLDRGISEFEQTLELMREGQVHPEDLITYRFPLGQIAEAFATANDKAVSQAIKVLVNP
jgi:threonine dehydrogenase-like Zn-dependent dehydrogenase